MKISLIYPSRGRPSWFYNTLEKWIDRAYSKDFEIIVSLDESDSALPEYQTALNRLLNSHLDSPVISYLIYDNKSTIEAVNVAAKLAQGEILMVISDDFDCPENWLQKIVQTTKGKSDFVLKINDGLQDHIITMPIMHQDYYKRFGYVYHPAYKHLWADTEFSEVAYSLGRVVKAHGIVFKHNHYSVIKSKPDQTYLKNEATYEEGKRIFKERQKLKFPA